jgi:hypothetical protein
MSLVSTDIWTACHLHVQMFGLHVTYKYRNKYIWFLTSVEEKSALATDGITPI